MSITLGQAHEAELTLAKAGATEEFWTRLTQNLELAKAVVALVTNVVFQSVVQIRRNMEGWKLLEPVPAEEGDLEVTIHEFLKEEDGGHCSGEEMVKRAKEQGVLTGLRHAEAMLRNQEKIPVEWRKFVLVFAEVWQGPSGNRGMWCLDWDGGRWSLSYDWLGFDFASDCRLLASRKCQKSLDT